MLILEIKVSVLNVIYVHNGPFYSLSVLNYSCVTFITGLLLLESFQSYSSYVSVDF